MLWVCPDILQLEPGTSGGTTHYRAQGGRTKVTEPSIKADPPSCAGGQEALCGHSVQHICAGWLLYDFSVLRFWLKIPTLREVILVYRTSKAM